MPTHTAPAPQRIWEIGTPSTDPHPPERGSAAGRLTAVAAMALAVSGVVSGRVIDASGGVGGIAAFVSRTVVVVAAAAALMGGFIVLAQAAWRLRRRAAGWAPIAGLWIAFARLVGAHGTANRTDPRRCERRVVAFLHSSLRTRG
jgi:hypothetical protein